MSCELLPCPRAEDALAGSIGIMFGRLPAPDDLRIGR